jgi:NAD(P)-dependent dehydrogenase (short-subunit alcohol dehydrogenase family)
VTTRRVAGLLPLRYLRYRHPGVVPYPVATRYDSGMDLDGAVAIVTGAAVGTGRAIAERLAAEGADVVVADVDEGGGGETVARIGDGRARFVRADMLDASDVEALIASAQGLRVLVNNAGGGGHIPPHFPDATPAEWGATLDLNLKAAMLATQLALEPMRRAGGGAIVNVASTAALGDEPYASPEYGAAKAGLIRFTTSLRETDGVRVSCVVPDWVLTDRARAELAAMTPVQRAAAPEPLPLEVLTDAVVALIRDEESAGRVVVLRNG